ncbi:N-glycosylase/DNA lyase [Acidianus ambivalens]|uniref:8-oxoguanine DNA glycosylase/AP lyase n=1 Tax=Acidianus ambivalens TaxID=2283 RepID=A0A650CST2_ACIAM|nr:N-glycosylase/DNA lyase [Acidianus ambivalens]MQL55325.1 N-glycosylase/DNA lyase [Acidianus ambivalens]QGR20866.1 N-glycosylase/DNA lyase [Acidianus ambivalens]
MLRNLVKNVKLRAKVLERAEEFKLNNKAGEDVWFRELVLCILTSNSSFISAYTALNNLYDKLFSLDEDGISKVLKNSGYRFYNLKAKYLFNIRKYYGKLKAWIYPIANKDEYEAREELLQIEGIGMKEASHFLRNVGYFDLAILDRHILKFLSSYYFSYNKKSLPKKDYIYIESVLKSISISLNLPVGLLDLFIWYKVTNKLVK